MLVLCSNSIFLHKSLILFIGYDFVHQDMLSIFLIMTFFLFKTGDLPPHNIWNQTRSDQLNALEKLTFLFQKYFPNKSIFPTLGNHETQPCNL